MAKGQPLPAAFDPDAESDKFLQPAKKRASKNFSRKKQASIESAMKLAYWLHVFKKDEEALDVCRFLGEWQFDGNFNLWSWIERTLALQSRIVRLDGDAKQSKECMDRVKAAGFVDKRLNGLLLSGYQESIQRKIEEGDKTGERDWLATALGELCFMIELGGSTQCPVKDLEKEFQADIARLRVLLKVS